MSKRPFYLDSSPYYSPITSSTQFGKTGGKRCFCQPWLTEKMLFYGSLISGFNTSVSKILDEKKTNCFHGSEIFSVDVLKCLGVTISNELF